MIKDPQKDFNDEFWAEVDEQRRLQHHGDTNDYPVREMAERAWEILLRYYSEVLQPDRETTIQSIRSERAANHDKPIQRSADNPLADLFSSADAGFYPPPELMFALAERWFDYLAAGGELTLEEVFLGPPKKKSGNYARRAAVRQMRLRMQVDFANHLQDGLTRDQAAERVSLEVPGAPDADSIKRYFVGFHGFYGKAKPEK